MKDNDLRGHATLLAMATSHYINRVMTTKKGDEVDLDPDLMGGAVDAYAALADENMEITAEVIIMTTGITLDHIAGADHFLNLLMSEYDEEPDQNVQHLNRCFNLEYNS